MDDQNLIEATRDLIRLIDVIRTINADIRAIVESMPPEQRAIWAAQVY